MLSDLIKELQAALDANGDVPVDVVARIGGDRHVLKTTAIFVPCGQPAPRLQITVQ